MIEIDILGCDRMNKKKVPLRQCTGCGAMKSKKEMLRVIKTPETDIVLDITGKKNGRGAYICRDLDCFHQAVKNRGIERSLKMNIPMEVFDDLEKELIKLER